MVETMEQQRAWMQTTQSRPSQESTTPARQPVMEPIAPPQSHAETKPIFVRREIKKDDVLSTLEQAVAHLEKARAQKNAGGAYPPGCFRTKSELSTPEDIPAQVRKS